MGNFNGNVLAQKKSQKAKKTGLPNTIDFKTLSLKWEGGIPYSAHSSKAWIDHGRLLDDGHTPNLSLTNVWKVQSVKARTMSWNPDL